MIKNRILSLMIVMGLLMNIRISSVSLMFIMSIRASIIRPWQAMLVRMQSMFSRLVVSWFANSIRVDKMCNLVLILVDVVSQISRIVLRASIVRVIKISNHLKCLIIMKMIVLLLKIKLVQIKNK